MSTPTCTINASVLKNVEKLRMCKSSEGKEVRAYFAKIDPKALEVVDSDELEDYKQFESISLEDLVDEIPDNAPRYLVLSYRYEYPDKRVSYPLVFIYYCPKTAPPTDRMKYASTQLLFSRSAKLDKVYMLEDKEEFTQKWLDEKVAKFSS
ncbi:hypothetical protein GGI21_000464 [Coemansia aciculifera]|nr:hypothetical protein GGI21_000464 [Coemansia aciculifera]